MAKRSRFNPFDLINYPLLPRDAGKRKPLRIVDWNAAWSHYCIFNRGTIRLRIQRPSQRVPKKPPNKNAQVRSKMFTRLIVPFGITCILRGSISSEPTTTLDFSQMLSKADGLAHALQFNVCEGFGREQTQWFDLNLLFDHSIVDCNASIGGRRIAVSPRGDHAHAILSPTDFPLMPSFTSSTFVILEVDCISSLT